MPGNETPRTDEAKSERLQSRVRCACPSWHSARECITARYGRNDYGEECECRCHEHDRDYDNDHL